MHFDFLEVFINRVIKNLFINIFINKQILIQKTNLKEYYEHISVI